ncbi:ATP-binding cassette domain-containing protein [Bifidobacterium apri]|uniref:ABC transporter, ATP-binding protein n=1 Tax=Bifidobacterium apri TaxID=1769423 RepID=A0A6A2VES9_9BIFI|nr:ATP-binding cassette domain-containing protein [Bifidobacterium apri]KAB8297545.1 ABC transporter, ATP-binding protein [Bifidobacterium apri]
MSIAALNLSHITYTYSGSPEPILNDITVTFAPGWTAVLGDNGIGKSTLMHIARGALTPERGQVSPSDAVIAFCPQDVAVVPANLDDFAGDWSPGTIAIRDTLGIADDWPYRYDTLSGGERKRLQIACALAAHPDVLILDEPTNHVDAPTRNAIAQAMLDFTGQRHALATTAVPAANGQHHEKGNGKGTATLPAPRRGRVGIVVSHDIELIDQVAMRCACFERRHVEHSNITVVTMRPGNYTAALADATAQQAGERHALNQANKEAARLQRESASRRHDAALAATSWRANRTIDRKDHDARNAAKLAKMTSVDGSAGSAQARLDARVHAAQLAADSIAVAAKRYDGDLTAFAQIEPSHAVELVRLEAGVIPFGSSTVQTRAESSGMVAGGAADGTTGNHGTVKSARHVGMTEPATAAQAAEVIEPAPDIPITAHAWHTPDGVRIPTLSVGANDHIGIIGQNGAGKTTILNALLARLDAQPSDVPRLVIRQNTTSDDAQAALSQLAQLNPAERGDVLSAMAQLNADPDRMLAASSEPSPGELRKLLLCLGIRNMPHLIVMDEPTNHLDLHSRQALARALAAYRGAVIVVSHDMPFLREAVTQLWAVRA